jgi:glutamate-1-semialdehyde 2,1-aminomutase
VTHAHPGARSRALWRRAQTVLAGGVNSPVRSFAAVGGTPVFFARGQGAYLEDVDGRRYLDLLGGWGANLLGHAPPTVVRAVRSASASGLAFGAPTAVENELAERIRRRAPTLERLRFVSSGTEAVMSAVRVARGFTGRTAVVKFAGGYHGHSDGLLARAGSGVLGIARPDSGGVPPEIARTTRVLPYNDPDAVERLFRRLGRDIAAVVVEPVAGNMGVVPPRREFLESISRCARGAGALVIADEVITGFRLRHGTIHRELGLPADLVTLGKVIGGGLPIGAYGGRRKVMDVVAPTGPVYQAGTLAGSPVVMAAGVAALDVLGPRIYRGLEARGAELAGDLEAAAVASGVHPFTVQRVGSMLGIFFAPGPVVDLASAQATSGRRYARFFHAALARGVYFPPAPLETTFVSAAVRPPDLARARPALRAALRAARGSVP